MHHNQCADRVMPAPPVLVELLKMYHFRWTEKRGDERRTAVCEVSHTRSKLLLNPDLCFISSLSNHLCLDYVQS